MGLCVINVTGLSFYSNLSLGLFSTVATKKSIRQLLYPNLLHLGGVAPPNPPLLHWGTTPPNPPLST